MDSPAASSLPLKFRRAFARVAFMLSFLAPAQLGAAGVEPEVTGSVSRPGLFAPREAPTAVFEPAFGETTLKAALGPSRCFLMRFPGTWQLLPAAEGLLLGDLASAAQVTVSFHAAAEFGMSPGGTLATSYAAHVEHDYEELLGRPVTTATMEPIAAGVYRWRGTWSDGNLDNAARALNLERFIVEAHPDSVIELSVRGSAPEGHDNLVHWLLSTLEVRRPNCRS